MWVDLFRGAAALTHRNNPKAHTHAKQQPAPHTFMRTHPGHLSCSDALSWELETNQCLHLKTARTHYIQPDCTAGKLPE